MQSTQIAKRMGVVLSKQKGHTDAIRRGPDVPFKKTNKMCPIQHLKIAQSKFGAAAV